MFLNINIILKYCNISRIEMWSYLSKIAFTKQKSSIILKL